MATTKVSGPSATGGGVSVGDDDYTKDAVEQPQSHVLAAPHEEDYPVERVEAVYRKLDMRIIPGRLFARPHHIRPIISQHVTCASTSRPSVMDSLTHRTIP